MTDGTENQAGAPVAPAVKPKRQASNLPSFTNTEKSSTPKLVEVGRFGLAVRTPYKDLPGIIKKYMEAVAAKGMKPDFVEGSIYLKSNAS